MILYHGSNQAVSEPQLIEQTRGLDFGTGFYLTSNEKQAVQFSEIVRNRQKSGTPTVTVYDFDIEKAERALSILRFESANDAWLRFVADNRLKIYDGPFYDMVIGAVANDKVMPTIQAYLGGFLNEDATIITLKTSKLANQYCLKSAEALSMLKVVDSY